MYLLDVLPYDPDRIRRIKPVIDDTINTLRDTIGATKEAVADSVAQTQLILDNAGAQSEASLILPIAVVAIALAGCLYLVHLYRRRLIVKC